MNRGLYIHIPFCPKKCPYCDFYSLSYTSDLMKKFVDETIRRLKRIDEKFDTLYFGGGTPSLLGADYVRKIISEVNLTDKAEVTLETNPNINFENWKNSGINRLSVGLQSANLEELKYLGRTHTLEQAKKTFDSARKIGIENISADLMIGIENMSEKSLDNSIDFCAEQELEHISSYILKIEEGTVFDKMKDSFDLPDEDETSNLYLHMVDKLSEKGYKQYEISNFSKKGYESKHNLKYWNCEEYQALGPSAHMFLNGERRYYPRSLEYYLSGEESIYDDKGGDFSEWLMLRLRLNKGVSREECEIKEKGSFFKLLNKAKRIPKDLISIDERNISLTSKGFLVSNAIIIKLID